MRATRDECATPGRASPTGAAPGPVETHVEAEARRAGTLSQNCSHTESLSEECCKG